MGRILAIDYGKKRVGLAVTDLLKITSYILPFQEETKIRKWLLTYFKEEDVETIVIGYPEHKDGRLTDLTKDIDILVSFVEKSSPGIEIIKSEESFTSKEAMALMVNLGINKKRRREKGLLDSYSALVILKEYLESKL